MIKSKPDETSKTVYTVSCWCAYFDRCKTDVSLTLWVPYSKSGPTSSRHEENESANILSHATLAILSASSSAQNLRYGTAFGHCNRSITSYIVNYNDIPSLIYFIEVPCRSRQRRRSCFFQNPEPFVFGSPHQLQWSNIFPPTCTQTIFFYVALLLQFPSTLPVIIGCFCKPLFFIP